MLKSHNKNGVLIENKVRSKLLITVFKLSGAGTFRHIFQHLAITSEIFGK